MAKTDIVKPLIDLVGGMTMTTILNDAFSRIRPTDLKPATDFGLRVGMGTAASFIGPMIAGYISAQINDIIETVKSVEVEEPEDSEEL